MIVSTASFREWPARSANRALLLLAIAPALVMLGACGGGRRARAPVPPSIGWTEVGYASWYGVPYHGRRAANGEVYDMNKLTAAHRTLPFGVRARVTSLDNGRSVEVRITDRGPFVDGRVIDVSRAAARQLEMIGPGTAKVRVQIVALSSPAPDEALFAAQAGAFEDRSNADRMRKDMQSRYGSARLALRPGEPALWRVLVGQERTLEDALELAARIRRQTGSAFVVRLDDDLAVSEGSESPQ